MSSQFLVQNFFLNIAPIYRKLQINSAGSQFSWFLEKKISSYWAVSTIKLKRIVYWTKNLLTSGWNFDPLYSRIKKMWKFQTETKFSRKRLDTLFLKFAIIRGNMSSQFSVKFFSLIRNFFNARKVNWKFKILK